MGPDDPNAHSDRSGGVWLWALLTCVWIAITSSLTIESVVTGASISAALAWTFARSTNVWRDVRFSPSRLYHFILYTGVFAVELVRANINMMRYVYARRVNVNPGIIKFKTRLKSPIGRLALANSISLTPGSLVLGMDDDGITVHWLDVQTADPNEAARIIAGPFEKHLERTFG